MKLEPCPFCGTTSLGLIEVAPAAAPRWRVGHKHALVGFSCFIAGPIKDTKAEAIAAWNHRTSPSSQSDDISRSDAGEEAGEPVASATPASGTDEALVEACAKAICEVGFEWYDSDIWREMWRKQARAILPIIKAREAAAHAAGRAEMRKEAVGYAKNLALEFEKGGAYDESVVATSLAEGICALGDKP